MKRTIVASVVGLAVGAGLVFLLAPKPPLPPTCGDIAGDPPHRASVNVNWDPQAESCYLHTVPETLHTCVEDDLIWTVHPLGQCQDYQGTLEIQLKPTEPDPTDLVTTPGLGEANGNVPEWPGKCNGSASAYGKAPVKCPLDYLVTLHPTGGGDPLVEDPNIDIWK
jgi:hypothetical protein